MTVVGFLQKDYELKISYLTNHFSRMLTRFNFFLTIQSALFVFSLDNDYADFVWLLCLTGIALALAWYHFGATDNFLVNVYRKQVGHAYHLLMKKLEPDLSDLSEDELTAFSYVSDIQTSYYDPEKKKLEPIKQNILQRRYRKISVTELVVIFPIMFTLTWVIRFVLWSLNIPA